MIWNLHVPPAIAGQLDAIGPPNYDWSDVLKAIEWFLTHDPLMVGSPTQDDAVRVLALVRPNGLCGVKVFYVAEEGTVTVLLAKAY